MFSGSFRAQLNSRSRRCASVLATAAVALHSCFPLLPPVAHLCVLLKLDGWLESEEWTFLARVSLGAGHALSFLATRWSTATRTCRSVGSIQDVDYARMALVGHRGKGGIVPLRKKDVGEVSFLSSE